jgi:exonuclease SbcC
MRLVSLHLWNLRSYTDATVEFGEGVNLFEGDIGSGKSTILLAVEFALFGLAEVASASLLRHGEKEGGAELVFGVKDRTFKATRKLGRTASGATVKGCTLEMDGKATKLSSNEMRQRVLELLEYGERRNPRARLDIFTYSVYTPQEEMRTVLTNDTKMRKQRKDTLRRALDLEEYDQAASNLDKVRLQLENDAAELKGMVSEIDEVRTELVDAEGELEAERERLTVARADLERSSTIAKEAGMRFDEIRKAEEIHQAAFTTTKEAEAVLARAEGRVDQLTAKVEAAHGQTEELEKVRSRIAKLSDKMSELEALENEEARLEDLHRELKEAIGDLERKRTLLDGAKAASKRLKDLEREVQGLSDPSDELGSLRKELEGLRAKGVELEHEVRRLEEETQAIDSEDEELTSLEGEAACPRCKQPLTEEHLNDLLDGNKNSRRDISSHLREAASLRNRLLDDIEAMVKSIEDLEGRSDDRKGLIHAIEQAGKDAADMDRLREEVEDHPALSIEKELKDLEASREPKHLASLRKQAGVLQELVDNETRLVAIVEGSPDLEMELKDAGKDLEVARKACTRASETLDKASAGWDREALGKAREEHQEALRAESAIRASINGIEKMEQRLDQGVGKLMTEVERLEGISERQALHVHVSAWLTDVVIPAIRSMERSVMSLMAEEMDEASSRWFGALVEDPDLVLTIDEDFVPSVAHQDFEMDLAALSGGERTAAAFAYRLALNGLVRANATPDQRNLLILDEPTDGFSREQLARMGNVFTDLAADQVVIVSHDRELRTFADLVHLVEKVGGSSTVQRVA